MKVTSAGFKTLAATLKGAVFLGSGYLLVRMIDWGEFWTSLTETSPWVFSLVVLLNLAAAVVMALRWHLLIRAIGRRIGFRVVTSYTMLGMFYNQILPGSVSGDAARIWCLGGKHTSWKESAGTVIWDRVLGLAALIFMTLFTVPWYYRVVMDGSAAVVLWGGLFAAFTAFAALQNTRLLGWVEAAARGVWRRLRKESGGVPLEGFFAGLRVFLTDRLLMSRTFFISLVIRVIWLLGACAISYSMRLPVPWSYYFFAIPLVELIRMVPVSIQGLGVRELAFVYFLKPYGVTPAQAALLSMLFFTALTVAGLLGGIVYLSRNWWGGSTGDA